MRVLKQLKRFLSGPIPPRPPGPRRGRGRRREATPGVSPGAPEREGPAGPSVGDLLSATKIGFGDLTGTEGLLSCLQTGASVRGRFP